MAAAVAEGGAREKDAPLPARGEAPDAPTEVSAKGSGNLPESELLLSHSTQEAIANQVRPDQSVAAGAAAAAPVEMCRHQPKPCAAVPPLASGHDMSGLTPHMLRPPTPLAPQLAACYLSVRGWAT